MALPLREAVRAIVIDDAERVLLVRFQFPDGDLWAAPGGGINPGESHVSAMRRELHEEVGLLDFEIGPAVWRRVHFFPLSVEFGGQRETFYVVPIKVPPGPPGFSEQELLAEGLAGSKWWTLTELNATAERFAPTRFPQLYGSLLRDGPPAELIDTGV